MKKDIENAYKQVINKFLSKDDKSKLSERNPFFFDKDSNPLLGLDFELTARALANEPPPPMVDILAEALAKNRRGELPSDGLVDVLEKYKEDFIKRNTTGYGNSLRKRDYSRERNIKDIDNSYGSSSNPVFLGQRRSSGVINLAPPEEREESNCNCNNSCNIL
jgi:hypothetical protein